MCEILFKLFYTGRKYYYSNFTEEKTEHQEAERLAQSHESVNEGNVILI